MLQMFNLFIRSREMKANETVKPGIHWDLRKWSALHCGLGQFTEFPHTQDFSSAKWRQQYQSLKVAVQLLCVKENNSLAQSFITGILLPETQTHVFDLICDLEAWGTCKCFLLVCKSWEQLIFLLLMQNLLSKDLRHPPCCSFSLVLLFFRNPCSFR